MLFAFGVGLALSLESDNFLQKFPATVEYIGRFLWESWYCSAGCRNNSDARSESYCHAPLQWHSELR